MIGLGSIFTLPAPIANAESVSNIQAQRSTIQSDIAAAEKLIKELQAEQAKLTKQIDRINETIKENKAEIKKTKNQIKETKAEIAALKEEIKAIEERIAQREEVLKDRAVSFQESGGDVNYLELLFGSTSFSDFIDRVGAIATIVEADQEILTQQEADKANLVEKKASVEEKLNKLNDMKVELEGMQQLAEDQKKQSKKTLSKLEKKESDANDLKASLQNKDANLANKIAAIQSSQTAVQNKTTAQRNSINQAIESSAAPSKANVSKAISAGYKYIGNSTYKFGGGRTASDIANGYFDCSGFVAWAYRQAGVSLPASTDALKGAGKQISTSQMQPGDLVFFDTYKKDGHVGIYVGGGKFIGSQSSTGVAIADMTGGYWGGKFNGRVVRVN